MLTITYKTIVMKAESFEHPWHIVKDEDEDKSKDKTDDAQQ